MSSAGLGLLNDRLTQPVSVISHAWKVALSLHAGTSETDEASQSERLQPGGDGEARSPGCRATKTVCEAVVMLLLDAMAVEVEAIGVLAAREDVGHEPPGGLPSRHKGSLIHTIVRATSRRSVFPGTARGRASG
jgi:hypothetical protein